MPTLPVEYRLMSLEFRNGKPENQRRLGFTHAVLLHDSGRKAVVIQGIQTPTPERDRLLELLAPFELQAIRYEIRATGFPAVPFCHPFPRGTDVYLHSFETGHKDDLYLSREGGKRFFSDDFVLKDVTNQRIDSNQRAFQFHE